MVRRFLVTMLLVLAAAGRASGQLPDAPAAPSRIAPASEAGSQRFAVQLNLLGFLQFGVAPGIEMGGRNLSVVVRYRAVTLGALSHSVLADSSDDETLEGGWSTGGVVRWYQARSGDLRDWFVGVGGEYAYVRVEDKTVDRQRYETWAVIPYGEAGYRWAWTNFFTEAGATLGVAIDQEKTHTSLVTGAATPGEKKANAFYMANFQIGWMF